MHSADSTFKRKLETKIAALVTERTSQMAAGAWAVNATDPSMIACEAMRRLGYLRALSDVGGLIAAVETEMKGE